MAAYPHNIERSGLRRGECVGYGSGLVWRIRKTGTGGWEATSTTGARYQRAATLAALSPKLEA